MKLLQYLKALSDLSFLYAMFGTLFVLILGANTAFAPVFVLALVLPLGYALRGKAIRFLAFAPALLTLFFVHSMADAIMPLVGVCYLFSLLKSEAYHYTPYHEVDRFHHQIIAPPLLILCCTLFGLGNVMANYTIPMVIVYLISVNLFLRFIRADATTLAQPSFLAAHLCSLGALFVGAIVLSSRQLRSAIFSVLQYIYNMIVAPVLVGIAMVVFYSLSFFIRILMWLFGGVTLEESAAAEADYSLVQGISEESGLTDFSAPTWLEWVVTIVFALVVGALIWYVLRKMLSGTRQKKDDDFVTVTQQNIAANKPEKRPLLPRTPRQKVRAYYASLMRHAKKKGIRVTRAMDTAQLAQKLGADANVTALTAAYRHARYDETRAISPVELADAKEALKAIKAKPQQKE